MISRALLLLMSLPSATTRRTMSRSVTVPTSLSFSQTGRNPTSRDFILCAPSRMGVSGLMHSTSRVMMSFAFMTYLQSSLFCDRGLKELFSNQMAGFCVPLGEPESKTVGRSLYATEFFESNSGRTVSHDRNHVPDVFRRSAI